MYFLRDVNQQLMGSLQFNWNINSVIARHLFEVLWFKILFNNLKETCKHKNLEEKIDSTMNLT